MSNPDDELVFNGLTLMQRHEAALKQTTAVMQQLIPFLITLQPGRAPDLKMRGDAAKATLQGLQKLVSLLLAKEAVHTTLFDMFGPALSDDVPLDEHNLRALRELHFLLDFLAPVVELDSVGAGQADLGRLERNHHPRLFVRDEYVDQRTRDHTELADRGSFVLLALYLAAKWNEKLPDLLRRLGLGQDDETFKKWAKEEPLEQRHLITRAGELDREGAGLSFEQQDRLSDRARGVLARHDQDLFPDIACLDDEAILRKLFARASRTGAFTPPR
jgi:hypothetical protein